MTLFLVCRTSTNYYQMLVLLQKTLSSGRLVTLSAPLRLFLTLTLNCEHTIARFIELSEYSLHAPLCATSFFYYHYNLVLYPSIVSLYYNPLSNVGFHGSHPCSSPLLNYIILKILNCAFLGFVYKSCLGFCCSFLLLFVGFQI